MNCLNAYSMTKDEAPNLKVFTRPFLSERDQEKGCIELYRIVRNHPVLTAELESNEYSVSIKLMYVKNKWKGELLYSYEMIDGDLAYHSNNNIGFRISYNLKHLYLRLTGTNILHLRKYEWSETNTSINYDSSTQYSRIPGYILATIGWRF